MTFLFDFLKPIKVSGRNLDVGENTPSNRITTDTRVSLSEETHHSVRSPVCSPSGLSRRTWGSGSEVSLSATASTPEVVRQTLVELDNHPESRRSAPAACESSTSGGDLPIGNTFSSGEVSQAKSSKCRTTACPRSTLSGAMTVKWATAHGLAATLTDDDGKKRGRPSSPWAFGQLPFAREPSSDSMRQGLRNFLEATSSRKRHPIAPRLLPILLLTGFVTVMVSYSALSPAAAMFRKGLPNSSDDVTTSVDHQLFPHRILFSKRWPFSFRKTGQGSELPNAQRGLHISAKVSKPGGVLGSAQPLSFLSRALKWGGTGSMIFARSNPGSNPAGSLPPRIQALPTEERQLWLPPKAEGLQVCIDRTSSYKAPQPNGTNGYLIVTANGGLNQMRAAICDMVAVARIMNATLVVPKLDHSSFWADPSEFEDIFQLGHFIEELRLDIRVVRDLPESHKHHRPLEIHPVSWSSWKYYRHDLLKRLKKSRVMVFPLTDSRLANNKIPESIQRLRCRANYKALKYSSQIETVSKNLVDRLQAKGPYIALHLRYEKDMLAFTGCTHGLSEREGEELRVMRLNNSRWKEKDIDGEARRKEGLCPLTPGETALFLRALGFPNTSIIYIAAGDIYGSRGLTDLTSMYPNTFTHNTLATPEELHSLERFQNRLAAVDYTVAVESDVFVYTYEGNMARAVQGHRRFEGHLKTIMPERRLSVKFIDMYKQGISSWSEFRNNIRRIHRDRMGGPHLRNIGVNPKNEENFFANPYPGCICEGSSLSTSK